MIPPLLAILLTPHAHALGPIPNGTYAGTESCGALGSFETRITVGDTTMRWNGQVNTFDFGEHSNGFFRVTSAGAMAGSGLGHLTETGLHYEIVFDYREEDGTSHPAPGEDNFTYTRGVLHLDGTASAGERGKISCEGDFTIVTQ